MIESELLSKIMQLGSLQRCIEKRVRGSMFQESGAVYEFILHHYNEYGEIPVLDTVQRNHPTFRYVETLPEPIDYYIDEVRSKKQYSMLTQGLVAAGRLITEDVAQTITDLSSVLINVQLLAGETLDTSWTENTGTRFEEYEELERTYGMSGVQTPWSRLNELTMGWQNSHLVTVAGRPKRGKCFGRGTPILMYDGTIKKVEEVQVGQYVMGPDSKRREILTFNVGREEMYRITPNKGDSFVCNESHILSLKMSSKNGDTYSRNQIVNVSIKDYLKKGEKFKHHAKLWRTGVDFPAQQPLEVPAYLLGIWLGDGTCREPEITAFDKEVIAYIKEGECKGRYKLHSGKDKNRFYMSGKWITKFFKPLMKEALNFKGSFLDRNTGYEFKKSIPQRYLISSRADRLDLLAGLMDTDGYLSEGKEYDFITKYVQLRDDVLFLAKSLGLSAYASKSIKTIKSTGFKGEYWRICINGGISIVPCKIKRKRCTIIKKRDGLKVGFDIEPIGVDEYYGFSVDQNHLFLLGDFTVVHNSWFMVFNAIFAVRNHHNVLFLTLEMSPDEIKRRADAVYCELPYGDFRRARLGDEIKDAYLGHLEEIEQLAGKLHITGDSDSKGNVGVSFLDAKIRQYDPRIVFIDGVYLMHDERNGKSKTEKLYNLTQDLKRVARRFQIPIVVSTQMGRGPESRAGGESGIQWSDSFAQDSDEMLELFQTQDMRHQRLMRIILVTQREGDIGSFDVDWNLETMRFGENEGIAEDSFDPGVELM